MFTDDNGAPAFGIPGDRNAERPRGGAAVRFKIRKWTLNETTIINLKATVTLIDL